MRWTVLIPAKALPEAKSRLAGASADAAAHRRLVQAIRADTVAAARQADGVARVVLVADAPTEPGTDLVFVQSAPGLNAALTEAAADAAVRWPDDGIVALLGDLPALQPAELSATLALAAATPRGFVADAAGTGTTLLAVHPGIALAPAFGAESAERHAASATPLDAGPGLRQDVDVEADLASARSLGLGEHTRHVLDATNSSSPAVHLGPA